MEGRVEPARVSACGKKGGDSKVRLGLKYLSEGQMLEVYKAADEEERAMVKEILQGKFERLDPTRSDYDHLADKYEQVVGESLDR